MKKKHIVLYIFCIVLCQINLDSSVLNILIYSLGIIPLAIVLGRLTSNISEYIGEKRGGLLAAAMGNIPELTMGIWAIKLGMVSMAKAALIGSIVCNILLVLGISIFVGGIKYKEQQFNKIVARTNFSMLFIALSTMIIIDSVNKYGSKLSQDLITSFSIKIAIVLICVYILGLIFSLYTHRNLFIVTDRSEEMKIKKDKYYFKLLIGIIISTILLYFISEKLIVNIQQVVSNYNISEEFIGIILIPILGNIGENIAAILCAAENKINLSLEIAIGSSIQIALFVTPILIIFSYILGFNMTLLFSSFQIIMAMIAAVMSFFIFQDGKTYWFEGAILIATYIIVAFAYYYIA
ncbi:calcium/proton exchanger [Clostridium botulinum]|nr:calcium/proton exchanger [Clostridium botulinum]